MRIWFLIGGLLLTSNGISQVSLSLGVSRVKEDIRKNDNSILGNLQLHIYNHQALRFDYTHKRFRINAECGYLHSKFNFETEQFNSSGGGSGAYSSDDKVWRSTQEFSYISYRIGLGYVFGSKDPRRGPWGQVTTGIFGQYDHRLSYRESNQTMDRTTVYDTYMGPGGIVTNYYPTDYSPFEHVNYVIDLFQFGAEIAGRVGINRYFGELAVSINSYDRFRTVVVKDNGWYNGEKMTATSYWCWTVGVKVGAYLNVKLNDKAVVE